MNSLSIAMRFRELKQEDAENYAKALRDSGHKDTCGHKKPHRCPLFLRTADGKHESNIACGVSRAYAWTVVSKALVSWGCAAPPLCNVRALLEQGQLKYKACAGSKSFFGGCLDRVPSRWASERSVGLNSTSGDLSEEPP